MAKPVAAGGTAAPEKKGKKKTFKKKERKHVPHGLCYVQASFNNTIVTITDMNGNVLSWKSSGSLGFRRSRRSRQPRVRPAWVAPMAYPAWMFGLVARVRGASQRFARWPRPALRCDRFAT